MKIVILGGGFGGLAAARRARSLLSPIERRSGERHEVVLIDKNPYHTYTPTLYEIAATSPETAAYPALKSIVTFPLADILQKSGVSFIQGEVVHIDTATRVLSLVGGGQHGWDYLVIALGAETNFFDIPGIAQNAITLKSFEDAVRIRNAVQKAAGETTPVTIAVGGGGTTGVELAGEIEGWLCSKEICGPDKAKVVIVEGGPAILKQFSKRIQRAAMRRLKRLGVGVVTNERVARVYKNEIVLSSEQKLPFSVFVWAGGIRAPRVIAENNELKTAAGGCLETTHEMRCVHKDGTQSPRVFAIGDTAYCLNVKTGGPVPAVARAAIDQGRIAAAYIAYDIAKAHGISPSFQPAPYRPPTSYSTVIPIGGKFAIAKIGPFVISGFFGWVLKGVIELNYLFAITSPLHALAIWIKGLWIFTRNDRLG